MSLQSFNTLFNIIHMVFFLDIYFASDSCVKQFISWVKAGINILSSPKTGLILELVKQQLVQRFLIAIIQHLIKINLALLIVIHKVVLSQFC